MPDRLGSGGGKDAAEYGGGPGGGQAGDGHGLHGDGGAEAGGGAVGFDLLDAVSQAVDRLQTRYPVVLQAFTGPFMDSAQAAELARRQTAIRRFNRFSEDFTTWLQVADATVSMAGYNTCMNLLATRVPALVFPYSKQREQPIRVEKIKNFIPMKILRDKDIEPLQLSRYIQEMFLESRPPGAVPINMDGAENSAIYLKNWMNTRKER